MWTKSRSLALLLLAACSGDDTASTQTYACRQTVADCDANSDVACVTDLESELSALCAGSGAYPSTSIYRGSCGGYTVVQASGIDTGETLYFDDRGAPVAFITRGVPAPACMLGPATFDACEPATLEAACPSP